MHRHLSLILTIILLLPACFWLKESAEVPEQLLDPDAGWVNNTLGQMNLDQKIGQMLFISDINPVYNESDAAYEKLRENIKRYHIGGLLISSGEAFQKIQTFNRLQTQVKVPLLFGAAFERGSGEIIRGGTLFTSAMGIAASSDTKNAYDVGRITAGEARAMGFHLTFSPLLDLSLNPDNTLFGNRSFGEDPATVEKFTTAYIKGVQEHGMLAVAKYFPGYGDATLDGNSGMLQSSAGFQDLQQNALIPFSGAIRSKVAAIMAAHVLLPEYDKDFQRPATLSPQVINELLQKRLGFKGLIFSAPFNRGAISQFYYEGKAAVKAINAGVDLILAPQNMKATFFAIREAVQDKKISIQRINDSVRKILTWKSVLGLNNPYTIDPEKLMFKTREPVYLQTAQKIARQAVTLLRNKDLPLRFNQNRKVYVLDFALSEADQIPSYELFNTLRYYGADVVPFTINQDIDQNRMAELAARTTDAAYLLLNLRFKPSEEQLKLIGILRQQGKPLIHLFSASPYSSALFPSADNLLFTYADDPLSQIAAAEAMIGKNTISGKLPVSISGIARRGEGITLQSRERTLFALVDQGQSYADSLRHLLNESIVDSAFPGCAISAGFQGGLVIEQGFGTYTYDPRSKKVGVSSIFDLASLTKVVATTTITMILYDQGLLKLDWKVADIIPDFQGTDKEQVTIRHLLTHTSGLPGWEKFYLTLKGKETFVREICNTDLIYQPGSQYVYSDLGMILMQKIIESIAQKPLDHLVNDYITVPLGMERTFFNPDRTFLNDIVPTEFSEWQKILVRGFVHDENAYAMGGVAGHAGLFSTVQNLAVFCQMYLNRGIYNFQRIIKAETVDLFTTRQNIVEGSTRALGWDTRSGSGSMSGQYMSLKAYGHSGFTGTSLWIDPARQVFVVFLSNRVHPTRENNKIRQIRPQVHDMVMKSVSR
jgi:beta-glucosidase-like glycosyl hydrolase/CubicO group peptidase (beta-lactamase class C family)